MGKQLSGKSLFVLQDTRERQFDLPSIRRHIVADEGSVSTAFCQYALTGIVSCINIHIWKISKHLVAPRFSVISKRLALSIGKEIIVRSRAVDGQCKPIPFCWAYREPFDCSMHSQMYNCLCTDAAL